MPSIWTIMLSSAWLTQYFTASLWKWPMTKIITVMMMENRVLEAKVEIRSAIDWIHCNPERKKKNGVRFLGNWLRRAFSNAAPQKAVKRDECKCGRPIFAEDQCGPCWYDPEIGKNPKWMRVNGELVERESR